MDDHKREQNQFVPAYGKDYTPFFDIFYSKNSGIIPVKSPGNCAPEK